VLPANASRAGNYTPHLCAAEALRSLGRHIRRLAPGGTRSVILSGAKDHAIVSTPLCGSNMVNGSQGLLRPIEEPSRLTIARRAIPSVACFAQADSIVKRS
jgi:hypothetical protein